MTVQPGKFVHRHVRKVFKGHGMFNRVVLVYNPITHLYYIGHTDGDPEDMMHDDEYAEIS